LTCRFGVGDFPLVHVTVDVDRAVSRRDPQTGRRRYFEKPKEEWIVRDDESLRIIPQTLWDCVQHRLKEIRGTWPKRAWRRRSGCSSARK